MRVHPWSALFCILLTACASLPKQSPDSPYVTVKGVYSHYRGKSYRPSAIAEVYSKAGALEAAQLARRAQIIYDSKNKVDASDVAWAAVWIILIIAIVIASQGAAAPAVPGTGPPSRQEKDAQERAEYLVRQAADLYNANLSLKR